MTTVIMFPGQGCQAVGMGAELAHRSDSAAAVLSAADEMLGRPLTEIIANGPKDLLDETNNAQPAIFSVNEMYWQALKSTDFQADFFVGHSLGELSACAAAEVFSFAAGLKIVEKRAELMARAAAENPGGMLAVLGLGAAEVSAAAKAAGLEIANYNSPRQIVVAGPEDKLSGAESIFKAAGASRVVRLAVGGPFHTSLMAEAAERFAEFLEPIEFADPVKPVVGNVAAGALTEGGQIKKALVEQISHPVRWIDCVNFLIGRGGDRFIETGWGKILSGLVKRISDGVFVEHADQYVG